MMTELNINKCKHIPCSLIAILNIKMSVLFKVFTIQSLLHSQWQFYRDRKTHPEIHMISQGILSSQSNLEREEQSWKSHTSFYFRLTTKLLEQKQHSTGIKADIWTKRIAREPGNKTLHIWSNDFWQECQYHEIRKGQSSQQIMFGKWTSTCKRIKLDPYLTPYAKIN